jgi:hypothetical protein
MRKTTAVGNVGNRHVDKTTESAGARVSADFLNDIQDELIGIQDSASIAEAAGTNEYVLSALIYNVKKHAREVGETFTIPGNVKAPAEFDKDDPGAFFPAICLTNFDTHTVVDEANWGADYITWLRGQSAVYNEGRTGETSSYSGSASGSVITLDDNAANNALLATMVAEVEAHVEEMGGDETNWFTVTWDGTEFVLADDGTGYPDIDSGTREITVTGTPTPGAGNLTVYPHRIAGSSTTARVYSYRGRNIIGAGYDGVISGFRRRDQMQRITGIVDDGSTDGVLARNSTVSELENNTVGAFADTEWSVAGARVDTGGIAAKASPLDFNSANSPNARTSSTTDGTTHGMDIGSHIYQHTGFYSA